MKWKPKSRTEAAAGFLAQAMHGLGQGLVSVLVGDDDDSSVVRP